MKNVLLFIILVIFVGILAFIIVKPQSLLRKVGPEIGDVVYLEADAVGSKTREEAALTVHNNLIPIHIDSLFLRLALEGEDILTSHRKEDLRIEAFSDDTLNLEATIRHKEVYQIIEKANEQNQDSLSTTLEGTLYYRFPLLGKTEIPFSEELKIRTPQLPDITLVAINVGEVDLPNLELEAQLEVVNHDTLEFTILQLDYDLSISDDAITAEGTTGENILVEGKDTTLLNVPIETSLGVIGDTFIQLIEEGRDWPYDLNANIRLDTDYDFIKMLVMNLQVSDTVDVVDGVQEVLDD